MKLSTRVLTCTLALAAGSVSAGPELSFETVCGGTVAIVTSDLRVERPIRRCRVQTCVAGFREMSRPSIDRFDAIPNFDTIPSFDAIPICASERERGASYTFQLIRGGTSPEKYFPVPELKDFPFLEYVLREALDGKGFSDVEFVLGGTHAWESFAARDIGNIPIPWIPVPF